MAPSRTRTVKNKHAANKSGVSSSKSSKGGPQNGVSKTKRKATPITKQVRGKNLVDLMKKKKKKVYTEKELGIPELNMVTPIGVAKPRGKKKGKVFVDDKESMSTILALVQADKEGEIESKMAKARQMEEIREARRAEAEKKEQERKAKLDTTKDSLRRKRKRTKSSGNDGGGDEDGAGIKDVASTGTKAAKPKKKRVSFA